MVVSIVLFVMVFTFRGIIAALMPTRRPSSKLSEGYFVVITVAMFFFFFYLVSPALFYIFSKIPDNYKLAEFFMTVLIFCVGNIFIALLDFGYMFFNMKKKKLMNQRLEANAYCQGRLH